jgi:PAP2 superfamily
MLLTTTSSFIAVRTKKLFQLSIFGMIVSSLFLTSCKDNSSDPTPTTVTSVDVSKPASSYTNDIANKWAVMNLYLLKNTSGFTPPVASRSLGYSGLAMYEAVVPGMSDHQSLAGQLTDLKTLPKTDATKEYNWALAANAAQYTILNALFATTSDANKALVDSLKRNIETSIKRDLAQDVTDRSIKFGTDIATAIFEWSKTDGGHEGYKTNFPAFTVPTGPGLWEPTENGKKTPMQPFWGSNRRFVAANASLAIPTILPFSYKQTSDFFKQYLDVYNKNKALTQEEKEISIWWADDPSETFTPPGHSYNIARIIATKANADLGKTAETFARTGIAVADAFMNCWKCKFTYNNLRPYTFVRATIDADWIPFWPAPPFPGFMSGHATQSAATGTVLTDLYGDAFAFTDNTWEGRAKDAKRNTEFKNRTFTKISDMAIEAAKSRFLGGIHTQQDNDAGLADGKKIGQNVNALKFKKPAA